MNLLLSVDVFNNLISDKDKKILENLTKIDVLKYNNSDHFSVELHFQENEYFENDKLVVTIHLDEDGDYEDGIEEIRGDTIEWKEKKNHIVKIVDEEERRIEESFFWFFKSFKAIDFEDIDESCIELDLDPLSDRCLFTFSKDIAMIFRDAFLIYLIPRVYGVAIEDFEEDADEYESVD